MSSFFDVVNSMSLDQAQRRRQGQQPFSSWKNLVGYGPMLAEMAPVSGDIIGMRDYWTLSNQGFRNILSGNIVQGMQDYANAIVAGVSSIPGLGAPGDVARGAGKFAPFLMGQVSPVFHGSPHKFTKFSTKAIGTGEGHQAFGWGLYFSDKKSIAKHYSKLVPKADVLRERYGDAWVPVYHAMHGNKKEGLKRLRDEINYIKSIPAGPRQTLSEPQQKAIVKYEKIASDIESGAISKNTNIYKASLFKGKDPSEYTWLDWYENVKPKNIKQISHQLENENVSENIDLITKNSYNNFLKLIKDKPSEVAETFSGERLYKTISNILGSEKEASLLLNRAGIDGIRYPAGSLSGVKSKGKNYVVFDENAITVEGVE